VQFANSLYTHSVLYITYINVPYSVPFRFQASSIVGLGLGLGLVVGLGTVLVLFFYCIFLLSDVC